MAESVIWSQEALDDLRAIAAYIARDSVFHARRVIEEILEVGDSIPEQPKLGRIVPELQDPKFRERFVYSYRLIYELAETRAEVLAVIHGHRLLESVGGRFS
jgi:plasmid stabilization system protein ParE